jgi:HlyD family secretion protein
LNYLKYAREELKQLEKMYRDKDLTEETEEIILKRQRNQIEAIEFNIESQKLHQDREKNLDRPRKDQTMQTNLQKATLAWQKAQFSLPLELNQKRLALQKLEAERAKTEERFAHLEADRAAMVVRSPSDGIVYHGHADRGVWNSATVTPRLHRNGAIQPNEVFMTVVSSGPLLVRADVEEKDLHMLKDGLRGYATPVGFPSLKLPARMKTVSLIPRTAGSFETVTVLENPKGVDSVFPGMSAIVKGVAYRNEAALLVASTAIFQDEGSETSYVYLAREGKPVKMNVEVGKSSGGKTEILKGLKEGDEILASSHDRVTPD